MISLKGALLEDENEFLKAFLLSFFAILNFLCFDVYYWDPEIHFRFNGWTFPSPTWKKVILVAKSGVKRGAGIKLPWILCDQNEF